MISMKKLSLIAVAGALMLAQGLASQAVTFTLNVPSATLTSPASNNFFTGVNSANNVYNVTLTPFNYPGTTTTSINNQSTVSFGATQIALNPGKTNPSADTFNDAAARFTFDVTANGVTNRFLVNGVIRDIAGGTRTDANGNFSFNDYFLAQSIQVNNGLTYSVVTNSPNLRPSVRANGIQFGSTFADIYVEQINPITNFNPNTGTSGTVGGYIGNAVPEPGAIAMMMGAGIAGSGFLVRRKRACKTA